MNLVCAFYKEDICIRRYKHIREYVAVAIFGRLNYGIPFRNVRNVAKTCGATDIAVDLHEDLVCNRLLFTYIVAHYAPFVCRCRRVLIWIKAAIVCPLSFLPRTISAKDISNGYASPDNTIYCFPTDSNGIYISHCKLNPHP